VVKWNLACLTDPDGTPADVMMVLRGAWAERCAFVNPLDKIRITGVTLEKKQGACSLFLLLASETILGKVPSLLS